MKFDYDGETLIAKIDRYKGNDRLAVSIYDTNGTPFATLSCNVPREPMADDEFAVKTWSENAPLIASVKHLFIETGRKIRTGHCEAPVWRIKKQVKFLVWRRREGHGGPGVQSACVVCDTQEQATKWINEQTTMPGVDYQIQTVEYVS